MARRSLYFLAALASGPLVALLVLAIGCAPGWPVLGVMCGHNAYTSLALLSLVAWGILVVVLVGAHAYRSLR
jgi:hypothetical protein